jgi:hypothetical protein
MMQSMMRALVVFLGLLVLPWVWSCGSSGGSGRDGGSGGAGAGSGGGASESGGRGTGGVGSGGLTGGGGGPGTGGAGAGSGGVGAGGVPSGTGGGSGAGGVAGTIGTGGAGIGGAGGITCPPCPAGEVCVARVGGPASDGGVNIPRGCRPDPCAPAAVSCTCAGSLCDPGMMCTMSTDTIVCGGRCAAPETPIATPSGERAIASLRAGDLVFSRHGGQTVVVPLLATSRAPVANHQVVRVTLETGAIVEMSAGHPTADGRTFGDLRAGTSLGALRVVDARLVGYTRSHTYDILPASDSGAYLAAGAWVGTTMSLGTSVAARTASSAR